MKSLLTRTASGAALVIVVAVATLWSQWSFGALLLAIAVGCVYEFNRMSLRCGYRPLIAMNLASTIAIFAFAYDGFFNSSEFSIPLAMFVLLLIPMTFVMELIKGGGGAPIINIALTFMPLLYIVMPISLLVGIPLQINGGVWSPVVTLIYILVVWSNDVFAYLFGVMFGKHYLCKSISPKKTWEGFLGGVAGSVTVAVCASLLLGYDVALWTGIAVIATLTGVLGDLVESMFKRSVDLKDSGSLMPGHGGWLDRFDSLILSAPFVFVFLLFIGLTK